ncbi:hypothetical protein [Nocardia sp. NPDC057227]|uniref:hypothetical protein n=1 Tax=Nocardia sp. NPDC057227 TaxID=3346056 RepID=UPI00363B60A6
MALVVGVEIPDADLAATVGSGFDRLPERLDAAGVGYVLLGADRAAGTGPALSPALTGTVFARRTTGLGLVAAASPQRDHPYNLARRIASLDHIARGRAGWLALRADAAIALGAPDRGSWAPARGPRGAELLADAVTAVRALWRTWPLESLTLERPARVRPPEAELRYADHTGAYASTGPLNVPTTPQGEPVVFWEHADGDGAHAATADLVLAGPGDEPAASAHLRLDAADPALRERITALADRPGGTGVLIRVGRADVGGFLTGTLPALAAAGVVRLRDTADPEPLRVHLGIDRRAEPDPRRWRPVYA